MLEAATCPCLPALPADVIVRGPPAVEPGMKLLMRAFCQRWVDSPDREQRGTREACFHWEANGSGLLRPLQVIPSYCLLMEFSVACFFFAGGGRLLVGLCFKRMGLAGN